AALRCRLPGNAATSSLRLKFDNQRGLGLYFCRTIEEVFAARLEKDMIIIEMGSVIQDLHRRFVIDQATIRSNSFVHCRREGPNPVEEGERLLARHVPLSLLVLATPPGHVVSEVSGPEHEHMSMEGLLQSIARTSCTGGRTRNSWRPWAG
ncbi:MAG: hypothetical protein ACKPKO_03185, partial [Candidatus Fonsibacter sp.]